MVGSEGWFNRNSQSNVDLKKNYNSYDLQVSPRTHQATSSSSAAQAPLSALQAFFANSLSFIPRTLFEGIAYFIRALWGTSMRFEISLERAFANWRSWAKWWHFQNTKLKSRKYEMSWNYWKLEKGLQDTHSSSGEWPCPHETHYQSQWLRHHLRVS